MRKTRIFLGLLLIIALMAFAGCGINDDGTIMDPDTPDVNDNYDNDLEGDVDDAVDNAGEAIEDLVTDGAVNNVNNKDDNL